MLPPTPLNENIHKNGAMRITTDFRRFFWRALGIVAHMAAENGTALSGFGKSVSLTFLECSLLLSILCVGFAEIHVCFQL